MARLPTTQDGGEINQEEEGKDPFVLPRRRSIPFTRLVIPDKPLTRKSFVHWSTNQFTIDSLSLPVFLCLFLCHMLLLCLLLCFLLRILLFFLLLLLFVAKFFDVSVFAKLPISNKLPMFILISPQSCSELLLTFHVLLVFKVFTNKKTLGC